MITEALKGNLNIAGERGPIGPQGNAATIEVGTTTTVSSSTPANVENVGDEHEAIFNFSIPQGKAATVSVGTTTTGEPGTQANVVNVGTSEDAVLNFTIPEGYGVPEGGSKDQILVKNSDTDYDYSWASYVKTQLETPLRCTSPYYIGDTAELDLTLPTKPSGDYSICVVFNALEDLVVTVTGTYTGDDPTEYEYETDASYCFVFYWNNSTWNLEIVNMTGA